MTVRQQIERIIDEGHGETREVIVQVAMPRSMSALLDASNHAIRRRSLSTSARDLVPPHATEMDVQRLTAAKKRRLRSHSFSVASQLAAEKVPAYKVLRSAARGALKSLMGSPDVRRAIVHPRAPKSAKARSAVREFWSSSSAVMRMHKDSLAKVITDLPNVVSVYPNRRVQLPPVAKLDPRSLPQNVTDNKVSTWGLNAVGAMSVWGAFGAVGQGVRVAVLDTGVDPTHPDLAGVVAGWAEFDEDGFEVPGSQARDSGQHGTHVAATIAGGGESGQWIGVAPSAEIFGGMVLPDGVGTDAQILAGIEWAIEQGVDIINLSLGSLSFSAEVFDIYTQAILNAKLNGISVVVAVGNEGSQVTGPPANDYFSYAVGATDHRDRAAGFSGGRTLAVLESDFINPQALPLVYSKPDVCAPGVAVTSAVPGDGYETWNGTSMATPHVAGALALLRSAINLSAIRIEDRAFLTEELLTSSVEELGEAGQDHRYGFGRIDVLRAAGFAQEQGFM